jgi:hypothetical protein
MQTVPDEQKRKFRIFDEISRNSGWRDFLNEKSLRHIAC